MSISLPSFLINENTFGKCFRGSSSATSPRISPDDNNHPRPPTTTHNKHKQTKQTNNNNTTQHNTTQHNKKKNNKTTKQQTPNNKHQTTDRFFFFLRDLFSEDFLWAAEGAAHAGAAKRRRERRHRAYLKYGRMSVAVPLSECRHRTSRGQRMDRAVEWERAALHGHVPEHPTPRRQALSTFPLTSKMWPAAGSRPDRFACVRPQGRLQRRTVEQTVDAPLLLTLDPTAPLVVEQLLDVLQFVDALVPVAEQVIEVPKIILENIPVRTSVREPQLAEQLVEVPKILTPFIQTLQNVDTPVRHGGRGASGGQQGFLPGQKFSLYCGADR